MEAARGETRNAMRFATSFGFVGRPRRRRGGHCEEVAERQQHRCRISMRVDAEISIDLKSILAEGGTSSP
jgi:hypothetical protein